MSLSKAATKNHFIVGIVLITLALIALIIQLVADFDYIEILTFVFGVWGGVEVGRYLEFYIHKKS